MSYAFPITIVGVCAAADEVDCKVIKSQQKLLRIYGQLKNNDQEMHYQRRTKESGKERKIHCLIRKDDKAGPNSIITDSVSKMMENQP